MTGVELIAKGVRSHGLRLHIWDIQSPYQMRSAIYEDKAVGHEIWQGLCGYTQERLAAIFNKDQMGFIGERNHDILQRILGSELT